MAAAPASVRLTPIASTNSSSFVPAARGSNEIRAPMFSLRRP